MTVDWKFMRAEYEVQGKNVKELSNSHHVDARLIQLAVDEEEWDQGGAVDSDTLDNAQERTRAMDILHQTTLVPKFIMLQAKMLDRCEALLNEVKVLEDAPYLKIVSEVIEKHRPAVMGVKKDSAVDNNIQVRIMTQVGDADKPSVAAVEVTSSAGNSNGIIATEGTE